MRRKHSVSGPSRLPWVLLFLTLAAGAGLAFYGFERYQLVSQEVEQARDELAAVKGDVGQSQKEKLELESQLGRAKVDLKDNRQRFSQYADQADDLKTRLAGIVGGDRSDVRVSEDRIILEIADEALFKADSVQLSDEGKASLDRIGDLLLEMRERDIQVEAHTSDVPVIEVNKSFETNWEYGAARATAVVRYLHDQVGIDPDRMGSVSFAEYRPISRSNKGKNERIDIALVPKTVQRVED